MLRVLLIDDDVEFRTQAQELIRQEGFEVYVVGTLEEARSHLQHTKPHLILVDLLLPDGDGLELAKEIPRPSFTKVVLITGHATVDSAVVAVRSNVWDYLTKPLDIEVLRVLLMRIRLEAAHQDMPTILDGKGASAAFGPLIGASPVMRELYKVVEKVAPTEVTVLINGESGTGKELVGWTIHEMSRRSNKPYLTLNCGALSPTLIGSELFGHERGSFTGAARQHRGYFERAHGGTLFLDEITEMPIDLQAHLLRVLETGRVIRLGGSREFPVDVRVIAATNRQTDEAVARGKFRKDLFFRLSAFPINVPPLREREGDVDLLAKYFLGLLNRSKKTNKKISESALQYLSKHTEWRGNVRELRNAMEQAYLLSGDTIEPNHLHLLATGDMTMVQDAMDISVGRTLEDVERELLYKTLHYMKGNKKRAAQSLGISLKTLYNRLARYEQEHASQNGDGAFGRSLDISQ